MAEPENHTLRLLRDIRREGQETSKKVDRLDGKVEQGFSELKEQMAGLTQAHRR